MLKRTYVHITSFWFAFIQFEQYNNKIGNNILMNNDHNESFTINGTG